MGPCWKERGGDSLKFENLQIKTMHTSRLRVPQKVSILYHGARLKGNWHQNVTPTLCVKHYHKINSTSHSLRYHTPVSQPGGLQHLVWSPSRCRPRWMGSHCPTSPNHLQQERMARRGWPLATLGLCQQILWNRKHTVCFLHHGWHPHLKMCWSCFVTSTMLRHDRNILTRTAILPNTLRFNLKLSLDSPLINSFFPGRIHFPFKLVTNQAFLHIIDKLVF